MASTTTYLSLKQDALRGYKIRQYVSGTVASYTTTWMQDLARLEPQGEFDRVDSWLRFTSGPANTTEVRVTGFSAGNQSIVFAPSVASLNASTGYYIAKTFSDADVKLAMNSAVRDMFQERIVQSFATAAETDGQYWMSIPSAAFNAEADLLKIDRSFGTTNSAYDYVQLFDMIDYRIDDANDVGTLVTSYAGVSGTNVRFHYRRPLNEFVADTDLTDEPPALILAGTKMWLAIQENDTAQIATFGKLFEMAKVDYSKSRTVKTLSLPRIVVRNFGSMP